MHPHTCDKCKSLVFSLEDEPGDQSTPNIQHVFRDDSRFTVGDAIEAANDGCSLCSWILYPSRIDWSTRTDHADDGLYFKYNRDYGSRGSRHIEITEFGFKRETEIEASESRKRLCRFIMYEESDTTLPKVQVSADESLEFGRSQLSVCRAHRNSLSSTSQPDTSPRLPMRFIKIDKSGEDWILKLVVNGSEAEPYAALSYSWGGSQVFDTKSSTLDQRECAIKFDDLPKTIQDAVQTAFALDIRYLWVDSLCILQDANDDQRKEFIRQDAVYSGASLTIAASRATNHREGFLNDVVFKLQKRTGTTSTAVILWMLKLPNLQEPLSERGWAFQEYLLSNRILFYESYRLRWLCSCNDDHAIKQKFWYGNIQPEHHGENEDGQPGIINGMPWQNAEESIKDWYNHVERFSHRKLTKFIDKLPAILGVLLVHYRFLEKPRVASGIWFPDTYDKEGTHPLPAGVSAGLLWFTTSENKRKLRNPSWSWTSLEGNLDMSYCLRFLASPPDITIEGGATSHNSRFPKGKMYMSISSEPMVFLLDGESIRLHGCIQTATLRSRTDGVNKTAHVTFDDDSTIDSQKVLLDTDLWSEFSQDSDIGDSWQASGITDERKERIRAKLLTKCDVPKPPDIRITLLRLYNKQAGSDAYMVGLILVIPPKTKERIRIGVFDFEYHDANDESKRNIWDKINRAFDNKRERVTII